MQSGNFPKHSRFIYLHLWAGFIIGVAYPLLDQLSRAPEFFVARRHLSVDVISLVLILCCVLPGLFMLLVWFVFRKNETLGKIFLGFFLVVFLSSWFLVNLRRVDSISGLAVTAFVLVVSVIFVFAYFQLKWMHYFFHYFSVLALVIPILFILDPSIRKVLPRASSLIPVNTVNSKVPVVMVIFDEMPLVSLLNEQGEIDQDLFPNFFALGQTSYWFRNATTIFDYTVPSVATLLTGKKATSHLATFMEYPNNLFTFLGHSYELQVFESATQLCPGRLTDDPYWSRMVLLFKDLSAIYLNLVVPKDLSYNLPDITRNWKNFWMSHQRNSAAEDRQRLFHSFLKSIHPSSQPALYFLHLALPHTPWEYLPNGKKYDPHLHPLGSDIRYDDSWAETQALQRHLVSVRFMDLLLGRLVEKLKQARLFDSALVIVTSDHGISFQSGTRARFVDNKNYPEIAYIPLFIKLPNQRHGIRSERNIQSIDVLATIADILDVQLPWKVEGTTAMDSNSPEPVSKLIYHSREISMNNKRMLRDYAFPLPGHNTEGLLISIRKNREMLGSRDLFRIGPNSQWIGQPISNFNLSEEQKNLGVEIFNQKQLESVNLQSDFLPAMITGELENSNSMILGIVLNDILVATTWTHTHQDKQIFSALLPESAFHSGRNSLSILWFPQLNNPQALMLKSFK